MSSKVDEVPTISSQPPTPNVCNYGDLNRKSVKELTGFLREIEQKAEYELYENHCLYENVVDFKQTFSCKNRVLGLVGSALFVSVIGVQILLFSGHLMSLPQDFMHFIHNVNVTHLAIGGVVTVVLIGGAGIVIYQACTGGEKLSDKISFKSKGAFRNMDKHFKAVGVKWTNTKGEHWAAAVYIDTSTQGQGVSYLYAKKECDNHYRVLTALALFTPVYLVATVVYNLLRAVIVPFYILGCWVVERFMVEGIFEQNNPSERKFKLLDIPFEVGKSIGRAIVAPFYALAFFFVCVFSLFNPKWRKLASFIERDWNHKESRSKSFWPNGGGPQKLWRSEGGGGPNNLGGGPFYAGGCLQPMGVQIKKEENIQTISLTEAVKEGKGNILTVMTQEELKEREKDYLDAKKEVEVVIQEYRRIEARVKELKDLKC